MNILRTNPLLTAASTLLCFVCELNLSQNRLKSDETFVLALHDILLAEVEQFQVKLKAKKIAIDLILAASYCLCSCLDELIMHSELSANYAWSRHSLLSIVHNETWGGERFFIILDYALRHEERCLNLLELIYLLLNFGYRGKFYAQPEHINHPLTKKLSIFMAENWQDASTYQHFIPLKTDSARDRKKWKIWLKHSSIISVIITFSYFLVCNYNLKKLEDKTLNQFNLYKIQ